MGSGGCTSASGADGPRLVLYRTAWWGFCGLAALLAVVSAALVLPGEILGMAILVALLAGSTAAGLYGSGGGFRARWTLRQVVTVAAAAGAVTTLAVGLSTVLGSSVLWLVALLAAGSPPAVRWYSVRLGFAVPVPHGEGAARSTADLCRQWHDSYEALRQAKTDRQRLRIVMERQRCLDELGRRDPEGLEAWLATAASPAGDPARFLKSQ